MQGSHYAGQNMAQASNGPSLDVGEQFDGWWPTS